MARKPGLPKLTRHNTEDAPEDTKWFESVRQTVNESVRNIEDIRSTDRGIKLLQGADVEMVEVDVQAGDPWTKVANAGFLNGWVQDVDPGFKYMKGADGRVEIRFSLTAGVDADVYTMPVGHIPDSQVQFSGYTSANALATYIIGTDGTVRFDSFAGGESIRGQCVYQASDATPIALSCWPKLVKTVLSKVVGVVVLDVFDQETSKPLPPGAVYAPVWESANQNGIPQVKLLNIAGLPYNRKSRVRLLFIGG